MKSILYIIFISMLTVQAKAQFAEKHHIYTKFGFELGTHLGLNISYNYIYNNAYSLEVGVRGYCAKSELRPSDYKAGLEAAFSLGLGNSNGNDYYNDVFLLVGKVIPINRLSNRRLNVKVGLAYTEVNVVENFQPAPTSFLGANYTYDIRHYNTISLLINPTLEYPFSQFIGVYVSPQISVNKEAVNVGVGIGLEVGLLRGKKKA